LARPRQFRRQLLKIVDPGTEEEIARRIATYTGPATSLGAALGAMVMGQHYGTRALRMIHSPATIRKYERILGVRFDEVCGSEFTPLSDKIVGIRAARELGGFWDVVLGRKKVKKKGWADEPGATTDAGGREAATDSDEAQPPSR
jgi:hypothetical protein